MDELLAFFKARLDERARKLGRDVARFEPSSGSPRDQWITELIEQAQRDIDADRRLVALNREALAWYAKHEESPVGELQGFLTAIKLRASVYDQHPDYSEEWRP